jgi:hypothetical protein
VPRTALTARRADDGTSSAPSPGPRRDLGRLWRALGLGGWLVVVVGGTVALGGFLLGHGPSWLGGAGAVAVSTAYTWALAVRTGGRPVVFGLLTLVIGGVTVGLGADVLRTGAAVLTVVAAAVLAVVATVPAVRVWQALREAVVAVLVAVVGCVAALGYEPLVAPTRFTYATLGLALALVFVLVHRLGAGLHGLGRRGIVMVVTGSVLLAGLIAYAELLRRYGSSGLVDSLMDGRRWAEDHLGGAPRPLQTLLGIPALVWGCHQRARRRQGWWACAYGVVGTATIAPLLTEPGMGWHELLVTEAASLVVGGSLGAVVILLDVALTSGGRGRRSRRAEAAAAVRPEPSRTRPLL